MVRLRALGLRGANLFWCSRHSTSRVAAVAAAHPNRRALVAISCRVGPAHPGADARTSSSPNSGTAGGGSAGPSSRPETCMWLLYEAAVCGFCMRLLYEAAV